MSRSSYCVKRNDHNRLLDCIKLPFATVSIQFVTSVCDILNAGVLFDVIILPSGSAVFTARNEASQNCLGKQHLQKYSHIGCCICHGALGELLSFSHR